MDFHEICKVPKYADTFEVWLDSHSNNRHFTSTDCTHFYSSFEHGLL